MENELKESFLRRLKEQRLCHGWIIRWLDSSAKEHSFFTESIRFANSFIRQKERHQISYTIEPHIRLFNKTQ